MLNPALRADGVVDRGALPRGQAGVREEDGGADVESLAGAHPGDPRRAVHTRELRWAFGRGARLLRLADRGFAAAGEDGALLELVPRDDEAARALLWHALAMSEGPACIRWITGAQRWAIDVLVAARLELVAYGALCVRGNPGPLRPFLPSGPFA